MVAAVGLAIATGVFAALVLAAAGPAQASHGVLGAHWPLDGPTADGLATPDVSGHGHDAAIQPGTTFAAEGRFGGALDLRTNLWEVRVPPSADIEPAAVTAFAWIRAKEPPGRYRDVLAKGSNGDCGDAADGNSSYALSTRSDEGLVFRVWNGVDVSATQSPAAPPAQVFDDAWHAVAGSFDGTTVRLYVDGVQVGNGALGTSSIAYGLVEQDLTLGSNPDAECSGHFPGLIDGVRIYRRALTPEEISTLSAGGELAGGGGPGGGTPQDQKPPPGQDPPPADPVPPPGQPPRALERPRIVGEEGQPGTYRCMPGVWEGQPANAQFRYAWRDVQRGGTSSTDATFTPREQDFGYRYYCAVTVANPEGEGTATSDTVFFTSGGVDTLPPPYGNVRVRGIDVFQTVQPNSGAQMFGFPSGGFAALPGIGVPTSYRLAGIGSLLVASRPQWAPYDGVILDALKPTTAVVYVSVFRTDPGQPNVPLEVTLVARRAGRQLGEPLVRTIRNPGRTDFSVVQPQERQNARFGVRMRLPAAWVAGGRFDLEARVAFPPAQLGQTYGVRECDGDCSKDNNFTLQGVPVQHFPQLLIGSIQLPRDNQGSLASPQTILGPVRALFPGGPRMVVLPYRATLDITTEAGLTATAVAGSNPMSWRCNGLTYSAPDFTAAQATRACRSTAVSARVRQWVTDNPARELTVDGFPPTFRVAERYDLLLAAHDYTTPNGNREPGWQSNGDITGVSTTAPTDGAPYLTANSVTRPLTAAGHEFGHALTAPHADTSCGGNDDGQAAEAWPPDERGRLQGTKFVQPGLKRISRVIVDDPFNQLFDLMSYCANNTDTSYADAGDAWLSARNWNRFRVRLAEFGRRVGMGARPRTITFRSAGAAAAQARRPRGSSPLATGMVGPGGGRLVRMLRPDPERTDPPADPSSPVRLRSLDAAGAVLLEAGVRVAESSSLPRGSGGTFVGAVAPGAAAVELVRDGAVLDALRRSAAPRVRLLAPRRGARVRAGGKDGVTVRWAASDADGQPLWATVQFSPDDGRSWRTVLDGPSRGSARVPGRYLEGTRRGRVRVTISDGFTEARAVSPPFRADGTRPVGQISRPEAGDPLVAGQRLLFAGSAFDDRDVALRGRSLRWYVGRRALGTGERVAARLGAGRHTVRLVAVDRLGRRTVVRRRIRVQTRILRLLRLSFPPVVPRGARTVSGTIRVSAPATLVAGQRRYRLGERSRRVTLALPSRPRTGLVRARYVLRARGRDVRRTVRGTVEVVRR